MGGGAFYQFMDGGALWLHLTGLPVSGWWHLVSGRVTRQTRELGRPLMVRVGCRGSENGNAAVFSMSEGEFWRDGSRPCLRLGRGVSWILVVRR